MAILMNSVVCTFFVFVVVFFQYFSQCVFVKLCLSTRGIIHLSSFLLFALSTGVATRGVGTGQSRKITKNHFSSL